MVVILTVIIVVTILTFLLCHKVNFVLPSASLPLLVYGKSCHTLTVAMSMSLPVFKL